MKKLLGSVGGAVTSAFGSAVCCAGPTVAASMGLSSAGLAAFAPYRPLFLAAAAVLILYAYHLHDREIECGNDAQCGDPRFQRKVRRILWGSTFVVLVFALSPLWIGLVL